MMKPISLHTYPSPSVIIAIIVPERACDTTRVVLWVKVPPVVFVPSQNMSVAPPILWERHSSICDACCSVIRVSKMLQSHCVSMIWTRFDGAPVKVVMCIELVVIQTWNGCADPNSGFLMFSWSVKVSCALSSFSASRLRPDTFRLQSWRTPIRSGTFWWAAGLGLDMGISSVFEVVCTIVICHCAPLTMSSRTLSWPWNSHRLDHRYLSLHHDWHVNNTVDESESQVTQLSSVRLGLVPLLSSVRLGSWDLPLCALKDLNQLVDELHLWHNCCVLSSLVRNCVYDVTALEPLCSSIRNWGLIFHVAPV